MKNDKYKKAFSGVKPSDEAVEKFKAIAGDDDAKIKKLPFSKTKAFRRVVSLAACFAIFVGIFSVAMYSRNHIGSMTLSSGVSTFKNDDDLIKYIKKSLDAHSSFSLGGLSQRKGAVEDAYEEYTMAAAAPETATNGSSDKAVSSSAGSYAKTYTQEEGVDEADIIKTYGDLIFFFHTDYDYDDDEYGYANVIDIFRVKDGKETLVKSIECVFDGEPLEVSDMFVTGDRLVINGNRYARFYTYAVPNDDYIIYEDDLAEETGEEYSEEIAVAKGIAATETIDVLDGENPEEPEEPKETKIETTVTEPVEIKAEDKISKTVSLIYDISDPSKPELLKTFAQSGNYTSSRMIGEKLYVISNFYADSLGEKILYTPALFDGEEANFVKAGSIAFDPESEGSDYIFASAIDVSSCKRLGESKAMLGSGFDVYCSLKNLYVYGTNWEKDRETTEITKISLDKTIEFVASAKVVGEVDDQYSFSERDDYLFVCQTVEGISKETNVLRVLDSKLREVAKSDYFAVKESIKAVKYIGDYAYVITYEETDPLFVIDISDPLSPKILGEAKISGFSTMLVDVGNNMLLGVGYCTGDYDYIDMEVTDGVKLALFDVSDPLKPVVLDSKEFKNIYSTAQENPKAFVQNPEKGLYAISYGDEYEGSMIGALVFAVENGKIVIKKNFSADVEEVWETRLTFVDDWYYIIDDEADFTSFKVD